MWRSVGAALVVSLAACATPARVVPIAAPGPCSCAPKPSKCGCGTTTATTNARPVNAPSWDPLTASIIQPARPFDPELVVQFSLDDAKFGAASSKLLVVDQTQVRLVSERHVASLEGGLLAALTTTRSFVANAPMDDVERKHLLWETYEHEVAALRSDAQTGVLLELTDAALASGDLPRIFDRAAGAVEHALEISAADAALRVREHARRTFAERLAKPIGLAVDDAITPRKPKWIAKAKTL